MAERRFRAPALRVGRRSDPVTRNLNNKMPCWACCGTGVDLSPLRPVSCLNRNSKMFSKKLPRIFAFAGTIAVALCAWVPVASSGSPSKVEDKVYVPIQSISYDFGSKSVSGYFVKHAATCLVKLMVFEKSDPEKSLAPSAMRVRLVLSPGQIAGLDSEEGRSLNFACGEGATTLHVDVGERDDLVALQEFPLPNVIAESPKERSNHIE